MVTDPNYVKEYKNNIQEAKQGNYVKFNNGEKKVLEFIGDPEHAYVYEDPRFGKRNRFIVRDFTDPMKPREDLIWDVANRWASIGIKLSREE